MTLRTRVASQRGLIGSAALVCGIGWVLWLVSNAAWPIVLPMLAMLAVAGVAVVARLVDEHVAGRRDWSSRLWALLCLELWFREFID